MEGLKAMLEDEPQALRMVVVKAFFVAGNWKGSMEEVSEKGRLLRDYKHLTNWLSEIER